MAHLSVTSTVDEQLTPVPVFLIDTVQVVLTVDETTTTDSFTYDAAGRMLTRDVNGTETALTWDASSNLTSTTADGVVTIYAYDAGGQRVAQATLAAGGNPGTATGYVAGMELTDPNTAVANNVTGTRFYTFGGATVAVRTVQGLSLLLGDEQGSAQIMMPLNTDSNGALLPATQTDADATERTAYAPYGARRGEDLENINRGWLGQVEDTGTGLTYLNARYYDPAIGRFLSPDPLMNPGDPRTLDPYRYADNNPITYHDKTGLCSGLTGAALDMCSGGGGFGNEYAQEYNLRKAKNGGGGGSSSGSGDGNSGGAGSVEDPVVVGGLPSTVAGDPLVGAGTDAASQASRAYGEYLSSRVNATRASNSGYAYVRESWGGIPVNQRGSIFYGGGNAGRANTIARVAGSAGLGLLAIGIGLTVYDSWQRYDGMDTDNRVRWTAYRSLNAIAWGLVGAGVAAPAGTFAGTAIGGAIGNAPGAVIGGAIGGPAAAIVVGTIASAGATYMFDSTMDAAAQNQTVEDTLQRQWEANNREDELGCYPGF